MLPGHFQLDDEDRRNAGILRAHASLPDGDVHTYGKIEDEVDASKEKKNRRKKTIQVDVTTAWTIYYSLLAENNVSSCTECLVEQILSFGLKITYGGKEMPTTSVHRKIISRVMTSAVKEMCISDLCLGLFMFTKTENEFIDFEPCVLSFTEFAILFDMDLKTHKRKYKVFQQGKLRKDILVVEDPLHRPTEAGLLNSQLSKLLGPYKMVQDILELYVQTTVKRANPPFIVHNEADVVAQKEAAAQEAKGDMSRTLASTKKMHLFRQYGGTFTGNGAYRMQELQEKLDALNAPIEVMRDLPPMDQGVVAIKNGFKLAHFKTPETPPDIQNWLKWFETLTSKQLRIPQQLFADKDVSWRSTEHFKNIELNNMIFDKANFLNEIIQLIATDFFSNLAFEFDDDGSFYRVNKKDSPSYAKGSRVNVQIGFIVKKEEDERIEEMTKKHAKTLELIEKHGEDALLFMPEFGKESEETEALVASKPEIEVLTNKMADLTLEASEEKRTEQSEEIIRMFETMLRTEDARVKHLTQKGIKHLHSKGWLNKQLGEAEQWNVGQTLQRSGEGESSGDDGKEMNLFQVFGGPQSRTVNLTPQSPAYYFPPSSGRSSGGIMMGGGNGSEPSYTMVRAHQRAVKHKESKEGEYKSEHKEEKSGGGGGGGKGKGKGKGRKRGGGGGGGGMSPASIDTIAKATAQHVLSMLHPQRR